MAGVAEDFKRSEFTKMKTKHLCSSIVSLFFFSFVMNSVTAQNQTLERLPISIKASVKWEDIIKEDDGVELCRTFGKYVINIDGTMKMNQRSSPVVSRKGVMTMPVEIYDSDMLTVTMSYDEERQDLRQDRQCADPLIERYHGSTTQKITRGPTLTISNLSSAMAPFLKELSGKEREMYKRSASLQSVLPDYYQFAVGGGNIMETSPLEIKVKGTKRKSNCEYEETEKRFPGFIIGLQMQLPQSGDMSGQESWLADCNGKFPPSFGIKISDMTVHGGEKPFNPQRKPKGNATYSLEWKIGN